LKLTLSLAPNKSPFVFGWGFVLLVGGGCLCLFFWGGCLVVVCGGWVLVEDFCLGGLLAVCVVSGVVFVGGSLWWVS